MRLFASRSQANVRVSSSSTSYAIPSFHTSSLGHPFCFVFQCLYLCPVLLLKKPLSDKILCFHVYINGVSFSILLVWIHFTHPIFPQPFLYSSWYIIIEPLILKLFVERSVPSWDYKYLESRVLRQYISPGCWSKMTRMKGQKLWTTRGTLLKDKTVLAKIKTPSIFKNTDFRTNASKCIRFWSGNFG